MNSENMIPARRPSGRLSKPSMELLVDNQRLLAHYIEPKKKRKIEVKKYVEEISSQSNHSEKSSLSSIEKYKPKKRKSSAPSEILNKIKVKDNNNVENIFVNTDKINGDKFLDNRINSISGNDMLNRTPYVSIELNDMVLKTMKSPDKSFKSPDKLFRNVEKLSKSPDKLLKSPDKSLNSLEKIVINVDKCVKSSEKIVRSPEKVVNSPDKCNNVVDDKSEDDLPLSKIYPDFKARVSDCGEIRDAFTLPPKKKVKYISIKEMNGGSPIVIDKSLTTMASDKVPKLKILLSPSKTSVMLMPKIPKKSSSSSSSSSHVNGVTSDSDHHHSPSRCTDVVSMCETNTDLATSTNSSSPVTSQVHIDNTKRCIRSSCTNIAIEDYQWDQEFCSPDCAIMYSKFLFNEWLNQRHDVVPVLLE